jgi:5'-3' exonuclease
MLEWDKVENKAGDGNNLLIVDGINFAMRFKNKGATIFGSEYLGNINSIARSYGCKKIILVSDMGASTFREAVYPDYKWRRKKRREEQTDEEKSSWEDFFDGYKKALNLFREAGHYVVQFRGVEGDDLAAYFKYALQDYFSKIWLCSTDGDWDQLLDENTHRFAYTSRKEFTLETMYDAHNCDTPEQFTHMKAIQGDSGDDVPGIDGIGPKRAYNLVREYGSVHELAAALPLQGNQLFVKNLNKGKEDLLRNLELVDLPSYFMDCIVHASNTHGGNYAEELAKIVEEIKNGL